MVVLYILTWLQIFKKDKHLFGFKAKFILGLMYIFIDLLLSPLVQKNYFSMPQFQDPSS